MKIPKNECFCQFVLLWLYKGVFLKAYCEKTVKDINMGFFVIAEGQVKVHGDALKMSLTCIGADR